MRGLIVCLLLAALFAGCAPTVQPAGPAVTEPRITHNLFGRAFFVAPDGKQLPLRVWRPEGRPRAVIVALHGMNDYSNAFALAGPVWAREGIVTYAIDQRGFGGNVPRGLWPGTDTLTADLEALVRFVRARHPGRPVHALGASMGGAVVLSALGAESPPPVDGAILVAPAVWDRETMSPLLRAVVWLAARTVPGWTVTGHGLRRLPSDNFAMLRRNARDPRVIKATRIDAITGLAELMDQAYRSAEAVRARVLLLYGERDEIIPPAPVREVIERLPRSRTRIALYRNGYHMLLRDRQRMIVLRDVAHWVLEGDGPLPSGADRRDPGPVLARQEEAD